MRRLRDAHLWIPRHVLPLIVAATYFVLVASITVALTRAHSAATGRLMRPAATAAPTAAHVVPPAQIAVTPSPSYPAPPGKPVPTPTPTPTPSPVSSGHVIFSDTFSGNSLGPAWTVISRHGEYAQNENECNVPGAVSVANNVLTITTTAQSATCGDFNLDGTVRHQPEVWPYTTGDVQWTKLSFTFGTVSYRARFPSSATSTWPAIWLLGQNCQATNIVTADVDYDTCPALGAPGYVEIDTTECYGSSWCQLALDQPTSFPTCGYPVDGNWHTYSVTWTSTAISVAMDGAPTGCSYSAADGYVIPQTPMFLIIQTQTGGVGGTPDNTKLPTTLQVSNVTVTQP